MSDSPEAQAPSAFAWGRPLGCAAICAVLALIILMPGIAVLRSPAHGYARARVAVRNAGAALKQYHTEYGDFPPTENIMPALRGQNPRGIVFFDAEAKSFNARKEFIDPWGTPYRFDLSRPGAVRVWSCGRNRQDEGGAEGSDDIASWR